MTQHPQPTNTPFAPITADNPTTTVDMVARHILTHHKGVMHVMRLNKLCYYAQAYALGEQGKPMFKERFEAWVGGPVCPELAKGKTGIIQLSDLTATGHELTDWQKSVIDRINDLLGHCTGSELSRQIQQETPWIEARKRTPQGRKGDWISEPSMRAYYREHPVIEDR